jgi:archaeosine-15-forming tRNA-guanine transglycosylase
MRTIEFKSVGHGPVTEVLVDGAPWTNVRRAALTIGPAAAPCLSIFVTGPDQRVVVEGVTVTVVSKPWPPVGVRSVTAKEHATLKEPA